MRKVLLVGPFPPPHGGVSVHVLTLQALLGKAQIPCRVLNINRRAIKSDRYLSVHGPLHFLFLLFRYSLAGWSLHIHINGHNLKSWLVALTVGIAGVFGPGAMLTVHSGMAPAYLEAEGPGRFIARRASKCYRHIIAVSPEIKDVLLDLSVPESRIEIMPAFFPTSTAPIELPDNLEDWWRSHEPVISTALFFRPEYGFELLVDAVAQLRSTHPRLGCVVMGDSECRPDGQKLIDASGNQDLMFAIGDVTHEACLAVIAHSDLFVRATFSDGDAISVREAIALGTPVVASDIVARPAGAVCFKTGDAQDLALKIESMLSGTGPFPYAAEPANNGLHRLLELYE